MTALVNEVKQYLSSDVMTTNLIRYGFQIFTLAAIYTPPKKNKSSLTRFLLRICAVMLLTLCGDLFIYMQRISKEDLTILVYGSFAILFAAYIIYPLIFYHPKRGMQWSMIISTLAVVLAVNELSYSFGNMISTRVAGATVPILIADNLLLILYMLIVWEYPLDNFIEPIKSGMTMLTITDLVAVVAVLLTLWVNFTILVMDVYCAIISFLLYILVVTIYISVYLIYRENDERKKMHIEHQMLRALENQVELTQSNLKELRKIRHDLKNQYAYMLALLKYEKYEELETELLQCSQQTIRPHGQIDCGNFDVSAILTMASTKAWGKGIHINVKAMIPSVLPFKNSTILSVISNLLDNAMEANERYGITDDIDFCISLRQEYLYIACFNRIPDDVESEKLLTLKSSKGVSVEHGIGTKIIREIAERCNGYAVFDIQDGMFAAEVLLDMLKGDDQNEGSKSSDM